jgi:hypothetical protein
MSSVETPFLLNIMGWKALKNDILDIFLQEKRFILAFPHSSTAEAVIASFYSTFDPFVRKYSHRFKTLINKNVLDTAVGPIFKSKLGAIAVDNLSSGNLNNIINELKKFDDYILLLSPKGSTLNKPWRTGWYQIAKELNLPILVVGLDFQNHEVKCSNKFIRIEDKSSEEVILELMEEMKIIPNKHLSTEMYETTATERGTFLKPENEKSFIYLSLALLIVILINYHQKYS